MLDTSVLINIGATGRATQVLQSLPYRLFVTDIVRLEFERGIVLGHRSAALASEMLRAGIIERARLDELGAQHFASLTIGPAASTLDDGEASAIAYGARIGATVAIDDAKAVRICRLQSPPIATSSTVDLLLHSQVRQTLGDPAHSDVVFLALQIGRMRVRESDVQRIISVVGKERAAGCRTLDRWIGG